MKPPKAPKLYNVEYYASAKKNAQHLETIETAKPIALAKWLKRTKGNTTHKKGNIRIKINKPKGK
jgi:hypothetical protein